MAGKNTSDFEYGLQVYGGTYLGDMEYGSIPVIGESAISKIRNLGVKVSGVWTQVTKAWGKVGGAWTETSVSARVGGIWELIHEK